MKYDLLDTVLDNGLRVIAHEDPTVAAVAVNVWYGVGSRHDPVGRTGFAHLFEHLMFQGSRHVGSGEHFSLVTGVGGSLNGTTSFDRTNYYETVPSHAVELALWLEADRMGSLPEALTQSNLDNQRDVVKNERRQSYDNQPYGTRFERLFAMTYPQGHPYHHTPIGSMADLDAADLQDAHEFFRTYYAPNNAVLSIAGDISAEAAVSQAKRYFSGIPRGPVVPAPRAGRVGPLAAEVRSEVFDEPVPAGLLTFAYRIPPEGTRESAAAALAAAVLGTGHASRLHARLVRGDELAQTAHAGVQHLVGGTDVLIVSVMARTDVELPEIEVAVDEEFARFAEEGPTPAELAGAKAQLTRAFFRSTETLEGLADEISRQALLFGDPHLINSIVPRINEPTAQAVHAIAGQSLRPTNRAVLAYHVRRGQS
jgi:predicted Zn-dependent peptidase